jgi:hypothetical protein
LNSTTFRGTEEVASLKCYKGSPDVSRYTTNRDPSSEAVNSSKQETQENLEKTEVSTQKEDTPETDVSGNQAKNQAETLTKKGEDKLLSTPDKSTTDMTGKQSSTEIDSPIQFITPLQFTRGNPDTEVVFIEDLTPIPIEEIPPTDFFFSKKRKVVVKRETHQRAGTAVKRYRVLTDGEALEEVEFTEEVAGSLGAYATTNQFSVGTLKERLKQKDLLINQLQNQIKTVEEDVRSEVNKGFEQMRANDRQEIQQLKSNLEEIHKTAQASQGRVIQQEELVRQLQAKLSSTESMVVDITVFQAQALEVRKKLEEAQQSLLSKVEIIQNHFQVIDQALSNIVLREREAIVAQTTFQEAVISSAKEGIAMASRLSISEQTRGDIILKTWESNIAEGRKMAKEVKESCEEVFGLLNKELLGLDKEDSSGILGQIDIAKHQLDIKTNMEEAQAEISQIKQVDIAQIDRWLVKPNLQLQSIISEDRRIEERLPQLEKKLYIF